MAHQDLTGLRFGLLKVIKDSGQRQHNKKLWLCKCQCGNEKLISTRVLTLGKSKSCGCAKSSMIKDSKTIHGMSRNSTYRAWANMIQRCINENRPDYKHYGGRGIEVCYRWQYSFENFLEDMGERPEGLTLDRIDNNGNYELSNCKWSTYSQQMYNRRPFKNR